MATMKTIEDLSVVQTVLRTVECDHILQNDDKHNDCRAGLCLKCGEIIYSCQPGWAARQCLCDDTKRRRRQS